MKYFKYDGIFEIFHWPKKTLKYFMYGKNILYHWPFQTRMLRSDNY